MSVYRVRLYVTGKVQGVFFRQTFKVMAKKNGIFGWVKNLEDGRVEAVLEGEKVKIDILIKWVRAGGPANARVDDVKLCNEKFTKEFSNFVVLY